MVLNKGTNVGRSPPGPLYDWWVIQLQHLRTLGKNVEAVGGFHRCLIVSSDRANGYWRPPDATPLPAGRPALGKEPCGYDTPDVPAAISMMPMASFDCNRRAYLPARARQRLCIWGVRLLLAVPSTYILPENFKGEAGTSNVRY